MWNLTVYCLGRLREANWQFALQENGRFQLNDNVIILG